MKPVRRPVSSNDTQIFRGGVWDGCRGGALATALGVRASGGPATPLGVATFLESEAALPGTDAEGEVTPFAFFEHPQPINTSGLLLL